MRAFEDDVQRVLELERELQSPQARGDVGRLRGLLAPTFVEIGASGRRWNLADILDLLEEETAAPITVHDLHGRRLGDEVIQVFWESEREGSRARRTSLWQRFDDGWQQVYHQGTPLP